MSLDILLVATTVLIILAFFDCLMTEEENKQCKHDYKATYDSYHKSVCIDCLKVFIEEKKKK